jgi:hypothetical protein
MHYVALASASERDPDMLERLIAGGTIGVAHHGEVTDVVIDEPWSRFSPSTGRDTGVVPDILVRMAIWEAPMLWAWPCICSIWERNWA